MFVSLCIMYDIIYIIFSTLPSVKETSRGKYTRGTHFEAKAQIERYLIFEVFPLRALSNRRELSCRIPTTTSIHARLLMAPGS